MSFLEQLSVNRRTNMNQYAGMLCFDHVQGHQVWLDPLHIVSVLSEDDFDGNKTVCVSVTHGAVYQVLDKDGAVVEQIQNAKRNRP